MPSSGFRAISAASFSTSAQLSELCSWQGSARSLVLQPVDGFIKKCLPSGLVLLDCLLPFDVSGPGIQLWETIMVRHGLMLVGQTVSGKTEVENAMGSEFLLDPVC